MDARQTHLAANYPSASKNTSTVDSNGRASVTGPVESNGVKRARKSAGVNGNISEIRVLSAPVCKGQQEDHDPKSDKSYIVMPNNHKY